MAAQADSLGVPHKLRGDGVLFEPSLLCPLLGSLLQQLRAAVAAVDAIVVDHNDYYRQAVPAGSVGRAGAAPSSLPKTGVVALQELLWGD